MTIGQCRFCNRPRELVDSHAIPNGIFRLLKQSGNGSTINVSMGDQRIERTSNSGGATLLCEECEGRFNTAFDGPLVNALKQLDREIQNKGSSARLPFSHDQMAQALISIVWRACESSNPLYEGVVISHDHAAELKRLVVLPQQEVLRNCSVSFARLWDNTPASDGGFDQRTISQLLFGPVPRTVNVPGSRIARHFGFDFALQGFLVHVVVPRLPFGKVRAANFLKRGATVLHAPPTNLFKYKPITDLLVEALSKVNAGHLSPSLSRRQSST